ncbi:MAG TPA: hypothetical protein VF980_07595 [Thermoanaerobaculia bacterium]
MRRLLALVFLVLFVACGKLSELPTSPDTTGTDTTGTTTTSPPPDPSATFTRVTNEVLTPNCTAAGCHGKIATQENQTLTKDVAYSQLVNVPSVEVPSLLRVKPGDPQNSYMYRKITGVGITGFQMPQGGPFLDATQIALVRDWILRGAPND